MRQHVQGDIVLEEDNSIYEKGDILRSFHHQARQPMSRKALLAGFLSVWLKRCVVPSPSSDVLPTVLLSTVRLVHSRSLGLLPAMCCIQRGLRALTEAFCRPLTTKRGSHYLIPRRAKPPDQITIHLSDGMVRSSLSSYYSSWERASRGCSGGVPSPI